MNSEKKDIILVNCPVWGTEYVPLSILMIKSFLERSFKVEFLDLNIDIYNDVSSEEKKLWEMNTVGFWLTENKVKEFIEKHSKWTKQLIKQITDSKTKIIGFSLNPANTFFSSILARQIRDVCPKITIMAGGVNLDSLREIKMVAQDYPFNFLIMGEGEITSQKLCEKILNKSKNFEDIDNIAILSNGDYKLTKIKRNDTDLNTYPFINLDGVKLKDYTNKVMPIISSIGCYNKCLFCSDRQIWSKYRFKEAKRLFNEIKFYHDKYGFESFQFHDLLVNGNMKNLEKFCDLVIKHKLKIHWTSFAIIRKEMTDKIVKKLKKAGCCCLTFGIESLSNSTLKKMKKDFYNVKDIVNVLKAMNKHNIKANINFIIGFPTETKEDFEETISNIRKHHKHIKYVGSANVCDIDYRSELFKNKDEYDLVIPEGKLFLQKWHTKDLKNTPEIRKERLEKLISVLREYNIIVESDNVLNNKTDDILNATDEIEHKTCEIKQKTKKKTKTLIKIKDFLMDKVINRYEINPKEPLLVDISMTQKCFFKCKCCDIWKNDHHQSKELSLEEWKKFIDQLSEWHPVKHVCIAGGEPFVREDVIELANHCVDKNMEPVIVSNGWLVDEKLARKIADSKIRVINFSIDGFEKTHDWIRGMKGAFKRATRAIDLLKEMKPEIRIGISTTINKKNMKEIDKFMEWIQNNKNIDYVNFQALENFYNYRKSDWYLKSKLWPSDMKLVHKKMNSLIAMKKKGYKIHNPEHQFKVFSQYFENPNNVQKLNCIAGYQSFAVGTDGSVNLCIRDQPIGNILETHPRKIYHNMWAKFTRIKSNVCNKKCHFLVNCYYDTKNKIK